MTYSQPFNIRGSKGEFRGARHGYLPALEIADIEIIDCQKPLDQAKPEDIEKLRVYIIDLQTRLNRHIDASKRANEERL